LEHVFSKSGKWVSAAWNQDSYRKSVPPLEKGNNIKEKHRKKETK
jgi:hypothetical protein